MIHDLGFMIYIATKINCLEHVNHWQFKLSVASCWFNRAEGWCKLDKHQGASQQPMVISGVPVGNFPNLGLGRPADLSSHDIRDEYGSDELIIWILYVQFCWTCELLDFAVAELSILTLRGWY